MNVFRIFFLLVGLYYLTGCSPPVKAPVLERNITQVPRYHRVKAGETLYSISWMYGLDYKKLIRWNRVARPYSIYPGQRLVLKAWLARKAPQKQSAKVVRTKKQKLSRHVPQRHSKVKNTPYKYKRKQLVKRKPGSQFSVVKHWRWPTRGRVIKRFSARDSGKKGISIAGRQGQAIIAAASGKVVYSGQGLIRYGKLIIIKHNRTYLSAYAHNRRLLVKEGQFVKRGQKIAEMGNTGTRKTILHFEIRKNGKPVNPLNYLGR